MKVIPLLRAAYAAVVAGALGAFFLIFALPFRLVPRGKRERYTWWTNSAVAYGIMRFALFCRIEHQGRDRLPFGKPFLVVANHRSWLDVPMLVWGARAEGISKLIVKFIPFLGYLGYLGGAVFFNRRRKGTRKKAKEEALFLLRNGVPLHVYPEGTRTRDGRLREKVHFGMLEACWDEKIPLVPAAVWGTDIAVPVPFIGALFGKTIEVRFAEPMDPAAYEDARSYAEACWAMVATMVGDFERRDGLAVEPKQVSAG